jgi:CRISPR-associated endoribonuclease Cas6
VQFATPTSFKTGDAELPLPVPRLCFQSWLNSWDEHAPLPFFPDKATRRAFLADVVEGYVSVTYSQLRLVQQPFYFDGRRTRAQGFVGTCRFAVRPAKVAPQHRQILAALARYSTYAGTGRKTTMGMGMTRYLEQEQTICQTT